MSKRSKIWLAVLAIAMTLCLVSAMVLMLYSKEQNKTILVTEYNVQHAQIPDSFDGKRIVHLTDLHNKAHGDQLTSLVSSLSPDIVVVTGDWIGRIDTDITTAKEQMSALVGIAPIYYVPGNHEAVSPLWNELRTHLDECGVMVLENTAVTWEENGDTVQIVGVFDPEFSTHLFRDYAPLVEQEKYSILLYHRPELVEEAAKYGADLLLCGHSHGGQIRLPLIGAFYVPNQGWFPKYDRGRFEVDGTTMIIGQGLGESAYMRILTPPEVVVVTLQSP